MFELRNSGENRRKISEIFFENFPREYKDLILVKKKFKIISCLCTFKLLGLDRLQMYTACASMPIRNQRPNSWTKSRQKYQEFSSLLFTVTYPALPWDFHVFKLTQPLTVSTVNCTLWGGKEENLIENHTPFPMVQDILTETEILRTLKIIPRNLNKIEFGSRKMGAGVFFS